MFLKLKANSIKQYIKLKTNLPSLTPVTLLHSFRRFQPVFGSRKGFEICKVLQKPRQKHNIFADLQEMFVISLSSFVIQQQILNLTNQCSLFMTVSHIF
jgi:hypothetical protein